MQSNTSQKISEKEFEQIEGESLQEQPGKDPVSGESPEQPEKKSGKKKEKVSRKTVVRHILWFFCGCLWGATLMFIGGVLYLRHNLIQEIPVDGTFDEIADQVGPAAQRYGWQVSYNPCGIPRMINNHPIEVYRFCKTPYARELLEDDDERKISCLLPCALSIYSKSNGMTYISKLNMPLLSQLLGGKAVDTFYEKITPEQRAIMNHIQQKETPKRSY